MSKGYSPFPVYDFKTGLHLARKPWLIPKDAFQRMLNGYIYRGQIFKRPGYIEWREPYHRVEGEVFDTTVDGDKNYNGFLDGFPRVAKNTVTVTDDGGPHETFTDDPDGHEFEYMGIMVGDQGGTGWINYDSGLINITYATNPGDGLTITVDYGRYPKLPIMGIYNYYKSTGSHQLVAFNTRRFFTYSDISGEWTDLVGSDTFSGNDNEFFWCENWNNVLYITNNVDRLHTFDGSSLSAPDIEFEGGSPGNQLDTCLLVFAYKGRLVLLRTTESGTVHAQRARWSKAASPTDFTNDGYVDAPTLDWIIGADFLGDDLIVFFERSTWMLKYTGSSDLPFRWEKVVDTEGAYATFGVFNFSDEIMAVGSTTLIATDGLDVYSVNKKIPDMVLDIDQQGFNYVYSFIIEEDRQVWISYPRINSQKSDAVFVFNYEENTWSVNDFSFSCFGYFTEEEDPTWDTMGELTWEDIDWSWDNRNFQAGFPTNLGGGHNGKIYKLKQTNADDGANIEFDLLSGDWNPFLEQGKKCRLGWVDVLVDRDPDSTVSFQFYADHLSDPVVTQEVTLDDGSNEDHIWVRVFANAEGETVRLRMYQDASGCGVTIHALVPYFKEVGRIGR